MAIDVREEFNNNLDQVVATAEANFQAATNVGTGSARWYRPTAEPVEFSFRESPERIHELYDRQNINQDYVDTFVGEDGKSGHLVAATLQVEFLAAQERAAKVRYASRCQLAVHAAARFSQHSKDGGIFVRGHRGYLARLFKAAAKSEENVS